MLKTHWWYCLHLLWPTLDYSDELIKQNAHLIKSSKNLIIDLRNNLGEDAAFDELMPYIAQGKIVRKGFKMRATEENLILLNHELNSIQDSFNLKTR